MVAQVDVSGIGYFLPILSFLIVWIVVFAVLNRTKIIEQLWLQIFAAFLVATIFIAAVGPSQYIINVTAWFTVFLISFFLILIILGLVGKGMEGWTKWIGIAFVILVILMFIVSAIVLFSSYLGPFLPWSYGGGSASAQSITSWLYSGRVMGAVLLLVVSAIVAFILSKAK